MKKEISRGLNSTRNSGRATPLSLAITAKLKAIAARLVRNSSSAPSASKSRDARSRPAASASAAARACRANGSANPPWHPLARRSSGSISAPKCGAMPAPMVCGARVACTAGAGEWPSRPVSRSSSAGWPGGCSPARR